VAAIVIRASPRKSVRLTGSEQAEPLPDAQSAPVHKSAIVITRRNAGRFGYAPDLTPEEVQRRGRRCTVARAGAPGTARMKTPRSTIVLLVECL